MGTEICLMYGAYLVWLGAGLGDFVMHWRTDLRHTSGVAESASHLAQLALLGTGIVVGLGFEVGPAIAALLAIIVATHACIGYIDSRIAFGTHRILFPVEQHLHSILDMAPIIALGLLLTLTWPAVVAGEHGWMPVLRRPALPFSVWFWVIAPAVGLCVVPALMEFRAAWGSRFAARAQPRRDPAPRSFGRPPGEGSV